VLLTGCQKAKRKTLKVLWKNVENLNVVGMCPFQNISKWRVSENDPRCVLMKKVDQKGFWRGQFLVRVILP
jgi:hypothetical protein